MAYRFQEHNLKPSDCVTLCTQQLFLEKLNCVWPALLLYFSANDALTYVLLKQSNLKPKHNCHTKGANIPYSVTS
jgi:hypothetical protein